MSDFEVQESRNGKSVGTRKKIITKVQGTGPRAVVRLVFHRMKKMFSLSCACCIEGEKLKEFQSSSPFPLTIVILSQTTIK